MAEQFTGYASLIEHPLYRNGGEVYIKHNGIPEEKIHSYLEDATELPLYFDENGILTFRSSLDLYNLPSRKIIPTIAREIGMYMNLTQKSVWKGHYGLFNEHRVPHVSKIAHDSSSLLQELGSPQETIDNAQIVGMLHDTGNLLMREEHERLGGHLAVTMYPSIANDPERGMNIVGSITHHNEGFYKNIRNYAGMPFHVRQHTLQNMFTDTSAAVLVADKADIGRGRISRHARNPETIDKHIHSEVNLHAESQGLAYIPDNKTLVWNLQYNPYITLQEARQFGNLIAGQNEDGRYIAYASSVMRSSEGLQADYYKVLGENLKLYGPHRGHSVSRFGLMADAALTMPGVDQFVIYYNDPEENHEPVEFVFNPDTADYVQQQMIELAESV
ncbi:MAG TPA: hypothetical protein PLS49_03710 [Candidatus Woesebacteria bacterium]|nr:hypothetical protein [Candidatus Woesebacteria bacterium]